ncbi:hypothetical protein Tco_1370826 [Tanacetum coccineum]
MCHLIVVFQASAATNGVLLADLYSNHTDYITADRLSRCQGSRAISPIAAGSVYQQIRRIHQLDTTYRPFHSEQRIDFYSLNSVYVLANSTAYSVNSINDDKTKRLYLRYQKKNCISNDNEGRMIERNFVEIQGTFFIKIRDNTFNGAIGENVVEHINKFLEVVGPIKINGVSQDGFRLSIFPISLAGAAEIEEDDDPDDITDIFKIEGNLFDFETPLCEAFNDFNYLLKIDKDLFTYDIQGTRTYEEYELNNPVTRDLEEPWLDNGVPYQLCDHICEKYRFNNGVNKWPTCSSDIDGFCNSGELPGMVRVGSMTYFQDHKWYDELADGRLKEETLMHKAKVEESWGYATSRNVGGRLMQMKLRRQRLYANIKIERAHDLYLEVNNIFGRNYDASNSQGHEERRDDPTLEPLVCKVRRFEMMKYSFNVDEEYIAIKESEYLNHSKNSLDAYRELLRIIDEGWVMATLDEE